MTVDETLMCSFQILKPSEKKKFTYSGANNSTSRPTTPPRNASGGTQNSGKKGKK